MRQKMRQKMRRFGMGIATLLGQPRGFFIPYRYAAQMARAARAGFDPEPNPDIARRFAAQQPVFAAQLAGLTAFSDEFARIGTEPLPAPRWEQDWFPRLDAAMAFAMVAWHKPAQIVEIGSGHSTRFLADAAMRLSPATQITAIDPAPRANLASLPVTALAMTLQAAAEKQRDLFATLGPGDMLFIDSSHILMPGTDVDFLLNRIVPALPAGVILHFHDIFLPDPYPAAWDWRGYNEQQALGPLICCDAFEPLFASHYVQSRMGQALAQSAVAGLPLPAGACESSLWLRKAGSPVQAGE